MIKALGCPIDVDLLPLSRYLWAQKIGHRISEQGNQQVVWVANQEHVDTVRMSYEDLMSGRIEAYASQDGDAQGPHLPPLYNSITLELQTAPWTAALLITSLLVTLLRVIYGDMAALQAFAIASLGYMGDKGEYWRIITPIFLHFSLLHLAFNMVILWVFGRQVETNQHLLIWCVLILFSASVSNIAQLYVSGPFFGGMSGVNYGILGYCWLYKLLNPSSSYYLPSAFMGLMMFFLILGYTALPRLLVEGEVANTAHLVGLICGLVMALCVTIISRLSNSVRPEN